MTRSEKLIEQLAAIEHTRWADWQRWMHGRGVRVEEGQEDSPFVPESGDLLLHREDVERWEHQIATPYADLSEREKQSDREQVMRYWPLIEPLLTEDPTP